MNSSNKNRWGAVSVAPPGLADLAALRRRIFFRTFPTVFNGWSFGGFSMVSWGFPGDFLGISWGFSWDFLGIFWGFSRIQRFKENWGRVSELKFFCGTFLCVWFEDSLTQCVKYAAKHDGKKHFVFLNRQPTPFHLSDVSSEAMLGQRSSGTAGIREGRCGRGRWEGSFQQV